MSLTDPKYRFNGVCPYFTMFPLDYPMQIIKEHTKSGDVALDPFCGRGTTLFAARLSGIKSYGIDSNPVAQIIAGAKVAQASYNSVISLANAGLKSKVDFDMPDGEFWDLAYHESTLKDIAKLRAYLLNNEKSPTSIVLQSIILGALHGPLPLKSDDYSYFSNQMPRTFSSKPAYSVRYWRKNEMYPRQIDVLSVIKKRAKRFLTNDLVRSPGGKVILGDSRIQSSYNAFPLADIIITSPPYYGLTTYEADQWLRNWFAGKSPEPIYRGNVGLRHSSPDVFSDEICKVWENSRQHAKDDAKLFIRFGSIGNRKASAREIIISSIEKSRGWEVESIKDAGSASKGKRQAVQMRQELGKAHSEIDIIARAK